MKLYDIFYHDNTMDSNVPFPRYPDSQIKRIVNTNWGGEVWIIKRKLNGDILVKLIREAREADYSQFPDMRYNQDRETEFRIALGGINQETRVMNDEGESEWIPCGYPIDEERRRLGQYWYSIGQPELTSLQFVEVKKK